MSFIITRSNGKVTQHWQDNKASWAFLMNGLSEDVQWKNEDHKFNDPKKFKSSGEAQWYLRKRAEKRTSPTHKSQDAQWEFSVVEVE